MTNTLVSFIINLIAGGAGGWAVGALLRQYSLGHAGDIVVGVIGGVVLGWLIPLLGLPLGSEVTVGAIVTQIVIGFLGGAVLMAIVGLVRDMTRGGQHA